MYVCMCLHVYVYIPIHMHKQICNTLSMCVCICRYVSKIECRISMLHCKFTVAYDILHHIYGRVESQYVC